MNDKHESFSIYVCVCIVVFLFKYPYHPFIISKEPYFIFYFIMRKALHSHRDTE